MQGELVRWGVIGCAGIAVRQVIPAIQCSKTGTVTAVASRSPVKARQTAAEFGVRKAYDSYEKIVEDPDIDAVYIPLPNHLHREWTIRAAQAGKHVLCEKPIALNSREAQEMVDVCRACGVRLAEAFMYRYHPRYERIREAVKAGEIGEIRTLHGAFSFNNAKDLDNIRYQSEMGGGSIYDVGCYPINAARFLLEQEPIAVTAHAMFSTLHDGVDMSATGLLEFEDGVSLTFECGMWSYGSNELRIVGSEGRIDVPFAYVGKPETLGATILVHDECRELAVPTVDPYVAEIDDFGRSLIANRPQRFDPEESVRNMRVIDACLESARTHTRVSLV
ncbi:Gfo/Idh/MocA family oxidoreductase [Alicyclobacillus fastidiosus]|uniref:Gfo/Idh/MocA family oxidoreductase n=1 Tax=Alicyclobacillus fastidiosus TaxID=392011 RepID=A0ABY6ZEF0_9BACL|nr:Gfo/Idh/MocA family oxidoreductase [Alicyclobacillus fastidiosus]WAH41110.1 Gfo/Idh/MocA family oxidoreductase [Alicyclobacillus fastidiosus]